MRLRRGSFVVGAMTLAGAAACGPLRSLAQHMMGGGSLTLAAPTTLPFTLAGNHIYIRASVGGTPYAFIFDTGGAAIVTSSVERTLKFEVIGRAQVGGAGNGTQGSDIVRVPVARIGDAVYRDGPFIVFDVASHIASPIPGLEYGGIFGRELFTKVVTTIDYANSTLTFTPPALFKPDARAIALPMTLRNGVLPNVRASVNGYAGTFDVDAGSGAGVTVTSTFAKGAGIENGAKGLEAIVGYGAGGPIPATVLRAKTFAVGGLTLDDPVVAIARTTGGVFADTGLGGNIGGYVLRRFTVTLDVRGAMLYLTPNDRLHDRFVFNRSGVASKPDVGGDTVVGTVPGSPAADADVRAGDVILALDGAPVSHDQITAAWIGPVGKSVVLTLRRGTTTLKKTLVLRDLV